jgi:hypothetical protein
VWQKRCSRKHVLVPSEVELHCLLISYALVGLGVFPAPSTATLRQSPCFEPDAIQLNLTTRVKSGEDSIHSVQGTSHHYLLKKRESCR